MNTILYPRPTRRHERTTWDTRIMPMEMPLQERTNMPEPPVSPAIKEQIGEPSAKPNTPVTNALLQKLITAISLLNTSTSEPYFDAEDCGMSIESAIRDTVDEARKEETGGDSDMAAWYVSGLTFDLIGFLQSLL